MKKTLLIVLTAILLLCVVFAMSIILIDVVGSSETPETSGTSADVLPDTTSPETSESFSETTTEITTEYITETVSPETTEEITTEMITEVPDTIQLPSNTTTSPYQVFNDKVDANKYDVWYKNQNEYATTQLEIQMMIDNYHMFWEEELAFTLKIAKPLFKDADDYESWKIGLESWLEISREVCRIERMKFSSAYQAMEVITRFTDAVKQKVIDTKYFLYLLECEGVGNYKDPYIGISWNEDEIIQKVTAQINANSTSGSQGLSYQIKTENGKTFAVLTGIGTCAATEIIVAEYYNGYPVTQIGEKAFYRQDQITSVTLSNYIQVIGSYAFYECRSLATFNNSHNLYGIQIHAFDGCSSLEAISLPSCLGYIESFAFSGCKSLVEIDIPDQIRFINDNSFSYCNSLETVDLPSALEYIHYDAFRNCTSLKEIVFPASIQFIYQGAFANCSSLESCRYRGAVAEWLEVEKYGGWRTGAPFLRVICTDGEGHIANTELDASDFADLPEIYRAVLNNEKTFIYSVGESTVMLLDDYLFPYLRESILSCDVKYAKVDMNGDGEVEVLLEGSCGDVLVLHHENGVVYGYDFLFRYMYNVKADGMFLWSYTGNKHTYGINKLAFSADGYTLIAVCYVESEGEDKTTYFIGEKAVSKSEYDAFYSTMTQEEVVWTKIDRYPIAQKSPPM